MSIKTLRKRIALVAVSALGVGLLSVAPAGATTLLLADNGNLANTAAGTGDSSGIVYYSGTLGSTVTGLTNTAKILPTSELRITTGTSGSSGGAVTVTGGYIAACYNTTNAASATLSADSLRCSSAAAAQVLVVDVKPTGVGTPLVIDLRDTNSSATWSTIVRITATVVETSTIGAFSASNSYLSVVTSGSAGAATDNVDDKWLSATNYLVAGTIVSNSGSGYFGFDMKDSNGNRLSGKVIGGNVSSGCVVGAAGTGTFNAASTTTANSYFKVDKATANAPASCTLTVTVNGVPVASRTFTFQGKLAKVTVNDLLRVKASTTANSDAFYVEAEDSAGNLLDDVAVSADSTYYSAGFTGIGGATTSPWSTGYSENYSTVTCPTKGSYKAKVKASDGLGATIYSNEFTIVCAGSPVNYSASLDKASYAPGEVATLTVTAKDSQGNLTHDYATMGTTASPVSITGGTYFSAVTAPANGDLFVNGVKKYKFTVGAEEGNYNFVVDLPAYNSTLYNQAAVTVPVSIKKTTSAVTNAEVLAAVVKLIASINKQIRALQKSLKR